MIGVNPWYTDSHNRQLSKRLAPIPTLHTSPDPLGIVANTADLRPWTLVVVEPMSSRPGLDLHCQTQWDSLKLKLQALKFQGNRLRSESVGVDGTKLIAETENVLQKLVSKTSECRHCCTILDDKRTHFQAPAQRGLWKKEHEVQSQVALFSGCPGDCVVH